jgi:TonB-dependent SusC/RagA subfamily outer membrane receptor
MAAVDAGLIVRLHPAAKLHVRFGGGKEIVRHAGSDQGVGAPIPRSEGAVRSCVVQHPALVALQKPAPAASTGMAADTPFTGRPAQGDCMTMSTRSLLLCFTGLLISSTAGCHRGSGVPAALPAHDGAHVGHGMQATLPAAVGIQSATPSELGVLKTSRIEDLFGARFAGVQVHRTGTAGIAVRIRGVEPLVVVDGLEGNSHLLLTVRAQDVVRIDVLKDPGTTAIYGERGRNGVIVITTRQGR